MSVARLAAEGTEWTARFIVLSPSRNTGKVSDWQLGHGVSRTLRGCPRESSTRLESTAAFHVKTAECKIVIPLSNGIIRFGLNQYSLYQKEWKGEEILTLA